MSAQTTGRQPREYEVKIIPFPLRPLPGTGRRKKPRHSSRTITWLYRRFVIPLLPKFPSSGLFIASSLPFLLESVSPEVTIILSAVFARRHADLWHGSRKQHIDATIAGVKTGLAALHASLPMGLRKAISEIRHTTTRHAAIICYKLALVKGTGDSAPGSFFLGCRDMQARLLLATPTSGRRILERLIKAGLIARKSSGTLPWKRPKKKEASVFRWMQSDTQ